MMTPKIYLMFKAFGDETRLRILHLLTQGELCVCDIIATLRLPQSTISRHLAYLRRAHLVKDRKEGLWKHYSLNEPAFGTHKALLKCLRHCFEDMKPLKQDTVALERYQKEKCY
jgi:ArsR family transcriptional regulator